MKKSCPLFLTLTLTFLSSWAGATGPEEVAAAVEQACANANVPFCVTLGFERIPIAGDVVQYRFEVQVGAGEHEVIRLHRIVKENAPFAPIHTPQAVLMAHGDRWGFAPTYLSSLASAEIPDDQSLAVFLAEGDVDVWGLDFRWVLVPEDVADLSFMFDWNLETDAADLGIALGVARGVRLATGSGFKKLHLAGFSRGGHASYVYLNNETRIPPGLRHVRGFIPLDIAIKSDDEGIRERACQRYEAALADVEAGFLVASTTIFRFIADLALTAPEDPSPFFSLFTNRQLAIDFGAFPRPSGVAPFFHSVGGDYDEDFFPQGLLYSTEEHWFTFTRDQAFHQPVRIFLQADGVLCGEIDTPLDDHFAEITVPVLYIGAGGGFGEFGVYNTTLLGSTDVTSLVVSLNEDRRFDLGHQELFLADNAENLFWQPILGWIRDHP